MSEAVSTRSRRLGRLLVPSFVDLFFVVLLLAAFARPGGWEGLLADGDTGWHIRTGQLVLETGKVPVSDPFSFTRPGEQWFAWEWLSDALFAALYGWRGLAGVAVFSGLVLCLAAAVLFRWLLALGAGLWVALAAALATAGASAVHYLARPHVFSILFYGVTLVAVDAHRRRASRLLWVLPVLCALWANLHAGFVILPATLAFAAAVSVLTRQAGQAARFGGASLACIAASLANPYGWRLHQHIGAYLNAPWILEHVQEFQSPDIRSESMLIFAGLLIAGVALAGRAMARGEWIPGALVLLWGFAALRSARHVPFFAMAAAPVVAAECARWWQGRSEAAGRRSLLRAAWDLGRELGRSRHSSVWIPVVSFAVLAAVPYASGLHFPASRFPVAAVERNMALLAPGGRMPRILSSDDWADYLIYRLYPRQRVFFDGRSDFYGPRLLDDYRVLLAAGSGWRDLAERYGFELALLPRVWPLGGALEREPRWRRVYADQVAVLYRRESTP